MSKVLAKLAPQLGWRKEARTWPTGYWAALRPHTGPVAAAWALSFGLMVVSAWAAGVAPLHLGSYLRFDSGRYVTIANQGYFFLRCGTEEPDYSPDAWCGNAGWFPGYPLLMRALAVPLFGNLPLAGWLIANGFAFLALLLLSILLRTHPHRRLGLLLAALFPGGMYYHAVFPISTLACLCLGSLLLLQRGRPLGGALAACGAAFSYSTGFLFSAVVGLGVLLTSRQPWPRRLLESCGLGLLALFGFLAVLAIHQASTGHWNAFFLVQEKYGHGMHNPLAALPRFAGDAWAARGDWGQTLAPLQSLGMALAVPAALATLAWHWRRATPLEGMVAGLVLIYWLFPITMGPAVSLTRAEAVLLPLVLLLVRLPVAVQWLLVLAFGVLRFHGGVAFFAGRIV